MLRLSLNASVPNCFVAALTLHMILILMVFFSDRRVGDHVLHISTLDPNVRVIFSPFGGSEPMQRARKEAVVQKAAFQKEGLSQKSKKSKPLQKPKVSAVTKPEARPSQAISRVAPPTNKKEANKKQPALKKQESKKELVEKKKAPDPQKSLPAMSKPEKTVAEKSTEQGDTQAVVQEIIVGRAQYEEYRIAGEVRSAIERTWLAPRGVDMHARCVLAVEIDRRGVVKKIETRISSGSALFDSAARYAASQTQYPKEIWGKALVVEFNP